MRIQYLSDLHIEFHRDGGRSLLKSIKPVGDVLVCAGDYTVLANYNPQELVDAFKMLLGIGLPVIYVPGNHEHYRGSFKGVQKALESLQDALPELGVLGPGKAIERGSQRFLGGTMWFPYDKGRDTRTAEDYMSDFSQISGFRYNVYQENKLFLNWIDQELRPTDVVVTHHLPSPKSTPQAFQHSRLNPFFVCNMEGVILKRQPRLWIHGHTHGRCDYKIGATRIVCNPHGYPTEDSVYQFRTDAVVEV